jgi:hydrogenase maturation protein HypF
MKVSDACVQRLSVVIRGAVQGVGFRPFVYRLATEAGLSGWVANTTAGVLIEVEGASDSLERFLVRLGDERPPRSFVQSLEHRVLDPVGYEGFEIRHSDPAGARTALVLPDIATCPDCLAEILDPADPRHRYPFTNCTHCGPRFSIIEALPYDRPKTTMKGFTQCDRCRAEYENPLDRRFHAQPNACPDCGPTLRMWDAAGKVLVEGDNALVETADVLEEGKVVALKGLGGFQFLVDARNETAVRTLRQRKLREEKPLAVLFPSIDDVREHCDLSEIEERLLTGPEAPIVLLRRRSLGDGIAPSVAPGNPFLGVMLPYTPLHHLLMRDAGYPIVATSGNLSDEPICTDEIEAVERLGTIADRFVVHDRPIARHVDDSVVRVVAGRPQILRRARGFAPLPIVLPAGEPMAPMVAVGAHLKNSVAISLGRQVFLSQHIGDLDNESAREAFRRVIDDLGRLWDLEPRTVVCDEHPDYVSTRYATESGSRVLRCQHHYAHVLACMAENEVAAPALGVSWDGTGLGTDGTIWGGEFLLADGGSFERVAHLRTFRLPGGESAIKQPWRTAIGLLYEIYGDDLFEMTGLAPFQGRGQRDLDLLRTVLGRGINAPVTSSAGRLFDAVSALLAPREQIAFEGQAAMDLEFALDENAAGEPYPIELHDSPVGGAIVDWEPTVRAVLEDLSNGVPHGRISTRFHDALVEAVAAVAARAGEPRIVLTGGCFQNRYLTERSVTRLRRDGFHVYWHQRVPPGDGGIALGQLVSAVAAGEE